MVSKNGDYFQSTENLKALGAPQESILLCGRYGVGKTCAEISLLQMAENITGCSSFVIDMEHKFYSALRSFGNDAPRNLHYRAIRDMNEGCEAVEKVLEQAKP